MNLGSRDKLCRADDPVGRLWLLGPEFRPFRTARLGEQVDVLGECVGEKPSGNQVG